MDAHTRSFIRFAQYNRWFNGQLFDCVAELDQGEWDRHRGAFFGSVQSTLNHILLGDRNWLGRIRNAGLPFPSLASAELLDNVTNLSQLLYTDFDELRAAREETDQVFERFVAELTPELLDLDLAYTNAQGHAFEHPLWHVLHHVFNHQTHHRGQITTLLTQSNLDVGMTDFIVTALMPMPNDG